MKKKQPKRKAPYQPDDAIIKHWLLEAMRDAVDNIRMALFTRDREYREQNLHNALMGLRDMGGYHKCEWAKDPWIEDDIQPSPKGTYAR